tara:strand:- start:24490 stop:25335 length:846 start_codon:yes stop_codon:yes gene_type:complete
MKVIFLQDFFAHQHLGGAELHDDVVASYFDSKGLLHSKTNTYSLTPEIILENTDKAWFISNFAALPNVCKAVLAKHCKYLIYEHDYKFLKNRNPIVYPDFLAPAHGHKWNFTFYRNAKKVICLSKLHRRIFDKNLGLPNIDNINCSMWSDSDLDLIKSLNSTPKIPRFAIIESSNPIKKTAQTITYCQKAQLPYDLIQAPTHHEFLTVLAQYQGLVFQTGHPEPTPRVAVEAKMLNCKFLSQKEVIGVAHEDWFHLNGDELIEEVRTMRDVACRKLENILR